MPLATPSGGRSPTGGKSGQRPFFDKSIRTASRTAARRRSRRHSGRAAYLRGWPWPSNQANTGNGGRPPAYSAQAFNGTAWRRGKGQG